MIPHSDHEGQGPTYLGVYLCLRGTGHTVPCVKLQWLGGVRRFVHQEGMAPSLLILLHCLQNDCVVSVETNGDGRDKKRARRPSEEEEPQRDQESRVPVVPRGSLFARGASQSQSLPGGTHFLTAYM